MISPGGCLKLWFPGLLGGGGGKREKNGKNGTKWQKIMIVTLMSQVPYIIWLLFMVLICKRISPGIFSYFQNFYFFGSFEG